MNVCDATDFSMAVARGDTRQAGFDTGLAACAAFSRTRRHCRAAIAERILVCVPSHAMNLDWDALDQAPAWLGLPEIELGLLQRRVGAVLHAAVIRLWIDRARINAARAALGDAFVQRLAADPTAAMAPRPALDLTVLDAAETVAEVLALAGAGVLLASLHQGPLHNVAAVMFAPANPAPIVAVMAEALIARAQTLATPMTPLTPLTPLPGEKP